MTLGLPPTPTRSGFFETQRQESATVDPRRPGELVPPRALLRLGQMYLACSDGLPYLARISCISVASKRPRPAGRSLGRACRAIHDSAVLRAETRFQILLPRPEMRGGRRTNTPTPRFVVGAAQRRRAAEHGFRRTANLGPLQDEWRERDVRGSHHHFFVRQPPRVAGARTAEVRAARSITTSEPRRPRGGSRH